MKRLCSVESTIAPPTLQYNLSHVKSRNREVPYNFGCITHLARADAEVPNTDTSSCHLALHNMCLRVVGTDVVGPALTTGA